MPDIRIGINVGEVIQEGDDVAGLAVDAAEHIQSKAKAGHILASELVRGVVGATEDVQFKERGRVQLKNFPGRWRLYDVPWQQHEARKESVTCCFLICDLVSTTDLFERLGDEQGAEFIRAYHAIARAELSAYDSFWSKVMVDNVFSAFRSPKPTIECAIALQKAFAVRTEEHSEDPIRARIALHVGEVVREADDFLGRTLNFAVRLSGIGEPETILASHPFRELSEGDESVVYGEEMGVELRGFPGKHSVYQLSWR